MAAFANIVRNAADGIREGNPKAKIAVLGMCCNEYFWMPEKFQFAKLILPALKGHFDCVALDALRDGNVRYSLVLCEPWKPTEKISSRRFLSVFLKLSD